MLEEKHFSGALSKLHKLSDVDSLGSKVLNKMFKLYISRNNKEFLYSRTLKICTDGLLETLDGEINDNEFGWAVHNDKLVITSRKKKVTHRYWGWTYRKGKMCFTGCYEANRYVVFRLEQV
jgi:hypothetical protein